MSTEQETGARLDAIEARLKFIESLISRDAKPVANNLANVPAGSAAAPAAAAPAVKARQDAGDRPSLVTSFLGWGGAVALVLAAAYLIRLAVESGWLTPPRQVAFAAISGLLMIAAGFFLRGINRAYAGLLPAGGIAILFLSIYGAHLFYGFMPATQATASVVAVCVLSLWLCRAFESDLYALFAVAGSYSAPVLVNGVPSIADLVIYFSAWGVVFSAFSVRHGRRLVYLLALYLALIVFDYVWRRHAPGEWAAALAYQAIQFAIFGAATVVFSIRNKSPLDTAAAWGHLPALLIFYFLEYILLKKNLPDLAPWIAVGSGFAVAGLYGIARATLQRPLPGGEFLVWAYVALVLFHAGYLEQVPDHWAPWVAFVALPVIAIATLRGGEGIGPRWPVWLAAAVVFLINYLKVVFDVDLSGVPARPWLAVAYAAQLYLGYYLVRERETQAFFKGVLLYAGHISAMAAALHWIDERIVESAAWGVIALACLGISLWQRDKLVGQSSLLVFGAAAVKVMLYDLGDASPMARIVSLVVLGVTFYVGGLLYQKLQTAD